jgi:ABC-type glutathione transport system ATPase component
VVVATHDSDLAAELADRTIALGGGRAVEVSGAAAAPTEPTSVVESRGVPVDEPGAVAAARR